MIIYTSHRELQEAIDKTILAYGAYTSDTMRNLTYEHLSKLFQIQAAKFKVNLFQSLCTGCHTLKGQDERKGIYNHYTAHGVTQ